MLEHNQIKKKQFIKANFVFPLEQEFVLFVVIIAPK